MKRNLNQNERVDALTNNGIDTSNMYSLNINIPKDSKVDIIVDGKKIPFDLKKFIEIDSNGNVSDASCVATNIMNNGYVFNSRTDGRWVTAQMFRMIKTVSFNFSNGKYESGFDAALRNRFHYMYQFKVIQDEIHRLAKMERSNDPKFNIMKHFFTKDVVVATYIKYLSDIQKLVKKLKVKKCRGKEYVRLPGYGDIFLTDLPAMYNNANELISLIKLCVTYSSLDQLLKSSRLPVVIPEHTPKCAEFKDAFKGRGAYLTLLNIVKFHGCNVENYETGEILDTHDSVRYIEEKIDDFKGCYWKYFKMLENTIEINKFDLKFPYK